MDRTIGSTNASGKTLDCAIDGYAGEKSTENPSLRQLGIVCHQLEGYARLCLTEARVPSFNGEKADLKPAITSFYMYFYVIFFLLPVEIRNSCLTEARVCHHLKADDKRCLSEARVPDFNAEKGYIMT